MPPIIYRLSSAYTAWTMNAILRADLAHNDPLPYQIAQSCLPLGPRCHERNASRARQRQPQAILQRHSRDNPPQQHRARRRDERR
jgi:hypothetical protein